MFCSKCGAENTDNDKFCRECGAALSSPSSGRSSDYACEEYILTYSISDDEDKLDGKNTAAKFYDTHFTLQSIKQNGGFNCSLNYTDINSASVNRKFSPQSLLGGIVLFIVGLWLISQIESDWAWYAKIFVWLLPLSALGILASDVNKVEISIVCKNGQNISFVTNNKKAAYNFIARINKMI
ncbi:MAG: zinc ribbon domain-containing protein [Porcipelethomonas sp.]